MDDKELEKLEMQVKQAQLEADSHKLNSSRQDVIMQEQDKSMITEQLDVSEILTNLHYLLRGYIFGYVEEAKQMGWIAPKNNDMVILSETGATYIEGMIQAYVNKNTLLSNYDEDTIIYKMEDFANTINDRLFMNSELMFCYPTLEDCKEEITKRIQNKIDIKKFANELLGIKTSDEDLRKEVLKEMEDRLEHEFQVVREQKIKSKLTSFDSVIRMVQDTVHSAYLRAWNGQERRTLREHIHITESKGGLGVQQEPKWTMNPVKAFGR